MDSAHTDDRGLAQRFRAAKEVAHEAGRAALAYFRNPEGLEVASKGPQDFVSQADGAVETLIRDRVHGLFPDDGFLGEEGGAAFDGRHARGVWVVDPIDGTANFVHRTPVWCVSIAYVRQGRTEVGVVYDPNADEVFAARRGKGAFSGETPLWCSAAHSLAQGAVGVGHSTRTSAGPTVESIRRLLEAGGMYQRSGSGALMLAYVAAGRLLGYLEAHINAWDCLAGILLVEEAGGWTNDFLANDGLLHGNPVLAAAPGVADALRGVAAFDPGTVRAALPAKAPPGS